MQFSKRGSNVIASHQGHFSDIVTVAGRSRDDFCVGYGAEDEDSATQYAPQVRFRGEFDKQCDYALAKIGRMLATRNAGLADIATLRIYLTGVLLATSTNAPIGNSPATLGQSEQLGRQWKMLLFAISPEVIRIIRLAITHDLAHFRVFSSSAC